jgi:hypothetical protein
MVLPSIPMAMLMPMMAFVLLSEGIRYWRNKKTSISGFTIQITTRRKKIKKISSLILQNSTKQIAHTQRKAMFESKIETHTFKSKTIDLLICKILYFVNFKSFNINDNIVEYLGITGRLMN